MLIGIIKYVIKKLVGELIHHKQRKAKRLKVKSAKQLKKQKHRELLIKMFGKTRYRLSYWFGPWVLYEFTSDKPQVEEEIPYTKFYRDIKVANRYASRLQDKYEKVNIKPVFDEHKKQLGYMLYGKEKKVANPSQQPSNVISIEHYKLAKVR